MGGSEFARRILITGVANFWGTGLARALLADPEVERVVGIDTRTPPPDVASEITLIDADLRAPELRTLIRAAAVDAIVHADIPQFPEPGRAARQLHDVTVMGTLQLLAAAGDLPTLRTLVVRGSACDLRQRAGGARLPVRGDGAAIRGDALPARPRRDREARWRPGAPAPAM